MKPAGFTDEGTFAPDMLLAGCCCPHQLGFTLKASLTLARGTVIYLKNGETQYEAYDGGTITAGSLLGILVSDVNTTGGAASVAAYISGEFNANKLTFATGGTVAAIRTRAAAQAMYLLDAVAA